MHRRLLATGLAAGLVAIVAAPALAADLAIEVHGVRSGEGQLYVAVHSPESAETFPSGAGMVAGLNQRAQAGSIRFVVRDLPSGRYAINAFHDENGNGQLDSNIVGIPTEGYGFANDPSSTFGPPKFDAAAVDLGDEPALAVMTLSYRSGDS